MSDVLPNGRLSFGHVKGETRRATDDSRVEFTLVQNPVRINDFCHRISPILISSLIRSKVVAVCRFSSNSTRSVSRALVNVDVDPTNITGLGDSTNNVFFQLQPTKLGFLIFPLFFPILYFNSFQRVSSIFSARRKPYS